MKRGTIGLMALGAAIVVGGAYGARGMNNGFYAIPGGFALFNLSRPSGPLVSAGQAVQAARRYVGPPWNPHKPAVTTFGVAETPSDHGPAWLVTNFKVLIPSNGPHPNPESPTTGAFLTWQTLDVVVNATTGKVMEAFTPTSIVQRL